MHQLAISTRGLNTKFLANINGSIISEAARNTETADEPMELPWVHGTAMGSSLPTDEPIIGNQDSDLEEFCEHMDQQPSTH